MLNLVQVSCIATPNQLMGDTNLMIAAAGTLFVVALLLMRANAERIKAAGITFLFAAMMVGIVPVINLNTEIACGDHLTVSQLTEALPYLNGLVLFMLVACGLGMFAALRRYLKLFHEDLVREC